MSSSAPMDDKEYLHARLRGVRDALLYKLEGLSDAEIRRPMTPTGTNLLGLVKHMIGGETNYLGQTFGRLATDVPQPWWEDGSGMEGADMYAAPGESTEYILDLYRRACAHSDQTITELDLDDIGTVPHNGDTLTLRQALVHEILETGRHAGHADIIREQIDGQIGERGETGLPDEAYWHQHFARVAASSEVAEQATNENK